MIPPTTEVQKIYRDWAEHVRQADPKMFALIADAFASSRTREAEPAQDNERRSVTQPDYVTCPREAEPSDRSRHLPVLEEMKQDEYEALESQRVFAAEAPTVVLPVVADNIQKRIAALDAAISLMRAETPSLDRDRS